VVRRGLFKNDLAIRVRIKMVKSFKFAVIAILVLSFVPVLSFAASRDKVTELKNELKEYKRLESSIHRHAGKLSASQKARLKLSVPKGLHDSDDDGVPDVIESHIDGTDDCNGGDHGSGLEVEVQGVVSGLVGSNFTVGVKNFELSPSVVYRNGDASALVNGACVEVKGATIANSTSYTATRVSFKSGDDC